jgi:hypothetical protein
MVVAALAGRGPGARLDLRHARGVECVTRPGCYVSANVL